MRFTLSCFTCVVSEFSFQELIIFDTFSPLNNIIKNNFSKIYVNKSKLVYNVGINKKALVRNWSVVVSL